MKYLFVVSLAFVGLQGLPQPAGFGNGVNVTQNGTVRIDNWTCYSTPAGVSNPPATKPCPTRIEIGDEVSNDVLICRSSKNGQVCLPLGKLFPVK